jgi:hypothetical protein
MFNFKDTWNSVLETNNDRKIETRDYVYASELGGSMIDRYCKMNGDTPTNPPNPRSRCKFFSGDIWENVVEEVLKGAGIKFRTQDKVLVEYPNLLRISGRVDFIVEGHNGEEYILENNKTDLLKKTISKQAKETKIEESILEIKSVGSYVFADLEAQDNPKTHHMLQLATYKKALNLPANIVYICRDDARVLQYSIDPIFEDLEKLIIKDLEQITYYIQNKTQPEIEPLMNFERSKFRKNWKVEYSNFLSRFYGHTSETGEKIMFQTPMEYRDYIDPLIAAFNRVIKRIEEGKELTKSNQDHIDTMLKFGFDIKKLK